MAESQKEGSCDGFLDGLFEVPFDEFVLELKLPVTTEVSAVDTLDRDWEWEDRG